MNLALDKGWRPEAPPLQGKGLGWGLSIEHNRWLQERAHEMRRNPTEPEKRLWRALSNSQLDGHKFRRQSVIGWFIADFLCPKKALIVEVDGDTHDEGKDRLRDDVLAGHGYRVIRVTNNDVMSNIEGVMAFISSALNKQPPRWNNPHPNPSPEGEGLKEGFPPSPSGEGSGMGNVHNEISLEGSMG